MFPDDDGYVAGRVALRVLDAHTGKVAYTARRSDEAKMALVGDGVLKWKIGDDREIVMLKSRN